MMHFKYFDTGKIVGKKIILDLDGTFLYDKHASVELEYLEIIKKLKTENQNEIFLLSNGAKARTKEIASVLGVEYIDTEYLKPNKKNSERIRNK
jgi:predicted HAD superfamily phosphohydrolase YqeG